MLVFRQVAAAFVFPVAADIGPAALLLATVGFRALHRTQNCDKDQGGERKADEFSHIYFASGSRPKIRPLVVAFRLACDGKHVQF